MDGYCKKNPTGSYMHKNYVHSYVIPISFFNLSFSAAFTSPIYCSAVAWQFSLPGILIRMHSRVNTYQYKTLQVKWSLYRNVLQLPMAFLISSITIAKAQRMRPTNLILDQTNDSIEHNGINNKVSN